MRLGHYIFKVRFQLIAALMLVSLYISAVSFFQLSKREDGALSDSDLGEALRQSHDVFPKEDSQTNNKDHINNILTFQKRKAEIFASKPFVKTCEERTNFVFIKCMKCATETMGTILRRYGYIRNLSFVVPKAKMLYLGWPYPMTHKDYRPSKTDGFNILVEHSIYTKSVMKAMMPPNTKYITIIREPYDHFKSVFNYFNIANVAKVPGSDPLTEYLHNLEKYETFYKSQEASPIRYCVPNNFSMTQNLLSHCLGMPLGFPTGAPNISTDIPAVKNYIAELDNDFSLVMLVEYFLESLVLLRRLMCWSLKDVLFNSVNRQRYRYKYIVPRSENVNIYSKWSSIDYMLYAHFNQTFWRKVNEQGEDFNQEVFFLYEVETKMQIYCFGENRTADSAPLEIPSSPWSDGFNFTVSEDCRLLQTLLFEKIKEQYDKL